MRWPSGSRIGLIKRSWPPQTGVEAGIVRAKRLLRTEREDDTSRGSQVVLVVLFPRCQALETGQQVIHSDWPEANVLVDLDVNTPTRRHGEGRLGIGQPSRYLLSGPGKQIIRCDPEQPGLGRISHGVHSSAVRHTRYAKQNLTIWSEA